MGADLHGEKGVISGFHYHFGPCMLYLVLLMV